MLQHWSCKEPGTKEYSLRPNSMTMSLAVVVALKDFLVALKDFLIAAIALRVAPEHQIEAQTLDIRP